MIKKTQTIGAIDIGSNAIRLLIKYIETYEAETEFKKAVYIRVPIRLGEDVFTSGGIGSEKEYRLVEAMHGFSHLMKAYRTDSFRACATSAMREADNGREVIQLIEKECGISVDIITGREEAGLIFKAGNFDTFIDRDKNYIYMDVGGGSTEIIVYCDHKAVSSESFRLGTVRMLSNAVDEKETERFSSHLRSVGESYHPVAIIGSGGNINKVPKLLKKKVGETVKVKELDDLYTQLDSIDYQDRMEKLGLNSYRADVIVPALYLFTTALTTSGAGEVIVPKVGLADGIIQDIYDNNKL